MIRKPRFELLAGKDGKFYVYLWSQAGVVVLSSRGFSNQYQAIQTISSMMRYGAFENRFLRRETADGRYFFQLLAPSGRVLGWSEMYHSKQGRDNGIVAVRRAVQAGRVLDLN